MWTLRVEPTASEHLLGYFKLYRDYFVDMFADSGLWNEADICAGYELLAFDLITGIRKGIEERMSDDIIIGWKQMQGEKSLHIIVGQRHVRILYHEDTFQRIRFITGLQIWRKK